MLRPVGTVSTIGFSLPPNETKWSFLVVLDDTNPYHPYLTYSADGLLPKANLTISRASYSPLTLSSEQREYFTERFVLTTE